MRREYRYLVIVAIILVTTGMLAAFVPDTVIYSLENDTFSSRFHENVDALKARSVNSTTDVMPDLQDLVDSPGPVMLSIRFHDADEARRDLELFAKNNVRVKNLIVQLDMSGTEIQDLSDNSTMQTQLLQDLVNSSVSLDALDNLEIQYRDQNRPDLRVSVQYQKEEILKKIHAIRDQYRTTADTIIGISNRTGLDPETQERSAEELGKIVQDIDTRHGPETIVVPPVRTLQLTLLVQPNTGTYGDTLGCFGFLFSSSGLMATGVPDTPVTLFLDNRTLATTTTSASGTYSQDFPVDRISAGSHTLYSQSGVTPSEVRTITITAVDSVTTMAANPAPGWGEINCSGTVQANRPVYNAPVELVWDKANSIGTTTDATGAFSATIRLPPGRHVLVARFSGDGYPIHPSESEPHEVMIYPAVYDNHDQGSGVFLGILSMGILSLFVGGALWYVRRITAKRIFGATRPEKTVQTGNLLTGFHTESPVPELPPEGPLADGTPPPASLAMRYEQALNGHGLSDAAHLVYGDLSWRIAGDIRIPHYQTLTPREFSRSCKGRSYCGIFAVFVSIYEIIRYAGQRTVTVQHEFEQAMETTRSELEGDDH